jgi:hypothetical protein
VGTAALLFLGLIVLTYMHRDSQQPSSNVAVVPAAKEIRIPKDPPPTLATYHNVAANSLEALDELLLRANAGSKPGPTYKASSLVQLAAEN